MCSFQKKKIIIIIIIYRTHKKKLMMMMTTHWSRERDHPHTKMKSTDSMSKKKITHKLTIWSSKLCEGVSRRSGDPANTHLGVHNRVMFVPMEFLNLFNFLCAVLFKQNFGDFLANHKQKNLKTPFILFEKKNGLRKWIEERHERLEEEEKEFMILNEETTHA
jgi:hypothetical protein